MGRQKLDMHGIFHRLILILPFLLLRAAPAHAFDFQIHGFADLVATKSDTDYSLDDLGNQGRQLTIDSESRLGLNLSADLGNKFTFFSQILGQGNDQGSYSLSVDWLFVTYRPLDVLAIRAGRQINPTFLYSEQVDVGYTYLWTRLPYEVYGLYPLDSFNGLSFIYTWLFDDLQLNAEAFGGAGGISTTFSGEPVSANMNDDKGIAVALSSEHFKVRAGYTSNNPTNVVINNVAEANGLGSQQVFSIGGNANYLNFILIAEVARVLNSGTFNHTATGAYETLGYRVLPSLTPYFNYAWQGNLSGTAFSFPDSTVSDTPEADQHAFAFGLNYKASPSITLKAEYMRTQMEFVDSTKNFGANTFTASADLVF